MRSKILINPNTNQLRIYPIVNSLYSRFCALDLRIVGREHCEITTAVPKTLRGGSGPSALSNAGSDTTTISRTSQTKNHFLRSVSPEEADSSGISASSSLNALTDRESLSAS